MSKYIIRRYLIVKLFIYAILSGLLIIGSVWFITAVGVDEFRIENSQQLANEFNGEWAYVQAPVLRRDVALDLVGKLSEPLYFTQNQIDQLSQIDNINTVVPLAGSAGDIVQFTILDYTIYPEQNDDDVIKSYMTVPSQLIPSDYLKLDLSAGDFPQDNSNQIAVSSYYKQAKVGDDFVVDDKKYQISGIIDDNATSRIVLPYTSDGYQQLYYKQTVSSINDFAQPQIDQQTVIYGDLLIKFNQQPTKEELNQIDQILTDGKVYYKDYTQFKGYRWLYIKLTWKKNLMLLLFIVFTATIMLSILQYIIIREDQKLRFYNIPNKVVQNGHRLEFYFQLVVIIIFSIIIHIILYEGIIDMLWTLALNLAQLVVANILSWMIVFIVKKIWGDNEIKFRNRN